MIPSWALEEDRENGERKEGERGKLAFLLGIRLASEETMVRLLVRSWKDSDVVYFVVVPTRRLAGDFSKARVFKAHTLARVYESEFVPTSTSYIRCTYISIYIYMHMYIYIYVYLCIHNIYRFSMRSSNRSRITRMLADHLECFLFAPTIFFFDTHESLALKNKKCKYKKENHL